MMVATTHGFKLVYNQGNPYLIFSVPDWEGGSRVYIRRAYNIDQYTCTADIKFKKKVYRVEFYK